jgi:hypothetical protein
MLGAHGREKLMMKSERTRYFQVITVVILTVACNTAPAPTTYDDCILQHLKAGMDEAAVKAVQHSCFAKFPRVASQPENKERLLSLREMELLDGRAGLSTFGASWDGTFYNGNDDITVTRLEIGVRTTIGTKLTLRPYMTDVYIRPKTTGPFYFGIVQGDKDADYHWELLRAWGLAP